MTSLQELNLSHSNIVSLPASIGQLKNLKKLYLDDTKKLSSLPHEIGRLASLEVLELRRSAVPALSPSIVTNLGYVRVCRVAGANTLIWATDNDKKHITPSTLIIWPCILHKARNAFEYHAFRNLHHDGSLAYRCRDYTISEQDSIRWFLTAGLSSFIEVLLHYTMRPSVLPPIDHKLEQNGQKKRKRP